MRVGSLFSGIGGLDLGLERAGMEVVWQVENDPYCQAVLAKHWPKVKRYGDIKTICSNPDCCRFQRYTERDSQKEQTHENTQGNNACGLAHPEPVDLICGGFPCQPVSLAGKRLGQQDERWLWPEFMRCVRLLRPRYVLVENVPGLLVRGFGDVLGDLAASGYNAEWDCIPAGSFGAHFQGYRVFIFAHRPSSRGLRWERIGEGTPRAFSEDEFTRLVERELRLCVPAGKNSRVSDGVSHRMDRLKGLGNSVVPQVAEWVGRRILECANLTT